MALPTQKTTIKNDFLTTKVCIVGAPKVGKSTFASQLGDNAVFLATEKGHDFLSIYKVDIENFEQFANAIHDLTATKHNFKTVVIDVMDKLIEICEAEICKRNKVADIKDLAYGAGYSATKKLMMPMLEKIVNANLGLIFITHGKEKEYKQENISWTAMGTSIPKSYEEQILGMCDLILYAYIDSTNKRMIRTKPNKYISCAGDRSTRLPEKMEMDAQLVQKYLNPKNEIKQETKDDAAKASK